MKKLLVLLALAFVLITCKKDEDEGPVRNIYTYRGSNVNVTDFWIIIRAAETGELLDAQQISKTKDVWTFETNKEIPNNKLAVTSFVVNDTESQRTFRSNTVSGIDVGSIEQYSVDELAPDFTVVGDDVGTYHLSVTDVPSVYAFSLSDKFGETSIDINFEDNVLSGDVKIREGASEQIVSIGVGSKPLYASIPEVNDGDEIELSFNDFIEFDKYLNVKFPENEHSYSHTYGFEAKGKIYGFNLYDSYRFGFWTQQTEFNIGYLDRFPSYRTQIFLNGDFTYGKRGSAPTSVDYVGADNFTITDKSIANYAVTTSQPYNYRMVTYAYYPKGDAPLPSSVFVSYTDLTPDAKHVDAFTNELIQMYSIPVDKITHSASYFYVKGQTPQEYLDTYLGNKPIPFDYETAYVTVEN